MKSVIRSIKPYWVFLIIARKIGWNIPQEKTVEVGKNQPLAKNWNRKTLIYCSKDKKSFNRIPEEYQPLMRPFLGKVIGEFICDRIDDFYCASVPYIKENNLGYEHFIDNGVYKVNGWFEGVVFERNDRYLDTMLNNNDLKEMCLSAQDIFDYIGIGKHLYGLHISNLKIYDEPKEITEFYAAVSLKDIKCKYKEQRFKTYNGKPYYRCNLQNCVCEFSRLGRQTDCEGFKNTRERHKLIRPPQSWCYVEAAQ